MWEDYSKRLLNLGQCKQHNGGDYSDTVTVDVDNADDAALAELLQGKGIPTPEPRPLSPNEGIRIFPHGEVVRIEDVEIDVFADGEIEIEMLSTLANAEPAALGGDLFPQGEGSKLSRPPNGCLGFEIGREDGFTHAEPIDINSKMTREVSSPLGYTENSVMGATKEVIDAEDWLETINAIHSSDQSNTSLFTPIVHGKH